MKRAEETQRAKADVWGAQAAAHTAETPADSTTRESPKTLEKAPPMKCVVFWDLENVPVPSAMSGHLVVDNIRRAVQHFGAITQFRAYTEIRDGTGRQLRSELQSAGVTVVDCQHNGRKDAIDHMIIVDMILVAADCAPPLTVVLISGDKDFVYAISTLRNRMYNMVLVVPNDSANVVLRSQASVVLEWRYDVLGQSAIANLQATAFAGKRPQTPVSAASRKTGTSSPGDHGSGQNVEGSAARASPKNAGRAQAIANAGLKRSHTLDSLRAASVGEESGSRVFVPLVREPIVAPRAAVPRALSVRTAAGDVDAANDDQRFLALSPQAPGFFETLFEIMERHRSQGEQRPSVATVANELSRRNPLLCARAGVGNMNDYIKLAAAQGIVSIDVGPGDGGPRVALVEDFVTKF